MPALGVYSISDFTLVSGPDPWPAGSNANSASPGNTLIMLDAGASIIQVDITDGDTVFDDADNSQDLAAPATINGTNYAAGQNLENEYAYVIRPLGSIDPAEEISLYAIDEGGNTPTVAATATAPLVPGLVYEIVAIETNNPSPGYASLYVCFAGGTRIATPSGEVAVERLGRGDMVLTLDHGAQPIAWIGRRELDLAAADDGRKPVLFRAGSLGAGLPERDLIVSPQHRMFVNAADLAVRTGYREALAPAKSFVGRPGVRVMRGCRKVSYHSILLPRHGIIFAEGAPAESFYPAKYGLSLLTARQRLDVLAALPALTGDVVKSYGALARPALKPAQGARLDNRRPIVDRLARGRQSVGRSTSSMRTFEPGSAIRLIGTPVEAGPGVA